jgi:molybdopterin molybdotransferase
LPKLLTIDEARERILERATPLASEVVSIDDAAHRILAESVQALIDLPPFPSSAMDGYAVRVADTPGVLRISARVAAGSPAGAPLEQGSVAAIATGGVVPEGADAIVPLEEVAVRDGEVEISLRPELDAHIRPRGGDIAAGAVLAEAGLLLGAAQIGALAAAGVSEVHAARRPRVAVLATGSELRRPGDSLAPGEIYDSNRPMLAAALRAAGAEIDVLPSIADDESAHRSALERGLAADVLVTTGGVSVGPHDLVRRIEVELGVVEVFWGVAVKPGKPLSFGVRGRTLVFGLPGNPVSTLVGSIVFVVPALRALQGASEPGPTYDVGRIGDSLRRNPHRDEFVRARRAIREEGVLLAPVSGQESHMIARAASADALIHVPRGEGEIASGDAVRYLALG